MEKDDFKKMDKKKKAEYINENLSEGMSFRDIYEITMNNNELAKSRETLINQFRKAGYRVNNDGKDFNNYDKPIITTQLKEIAPQSDIKNNTQLERILQSSEDIMQMLEWWKNNINNSPELAGDRLNIQIPAGNEIRKTLRINSTVWDEWKEFCSRQTDFTEKDLLAKALLYYLNQAD